MVRIKRLVQPERSSSNWKAVIAVFGLAAITAGCSIANATSEANAPIIVDKPEQRAVVDFKSCSKPEWPAADLNAGHSGAVVLRFLISKEGKALDSAIVKSSGYPGLDQAAQEGIAKCHFSPAVNEGKPVQSWTQMQYVWLLN